MQVILIRSHNSAVANNPVLGVFTDEAAAEAAIEVFKNAEEAQMKERWKDDWSKFTSLFYREFYTADVPAQILADKKYPKD